MWYRSHLVRLVDLDLWIHQTVPPSGAVILARTALSSVANASHLRTGRDWFFASLFEIMLRLKRKIIQGFFQLCHVLFLGQKCLNFVFIDIFKEKTIV